MVKETCTLESKETLLVFRKELKEKGFTEAKLIYRAGQYVMTFLTGKVSEFELMELGYIKKSKEYIESKKKEKRKTDFR